MSDKGSEDEEYFGNDNDSPVHRAAQDNDDEGDPELALRNEDEEDNEDPAQEPEDGEDKDDAGYGADEAYGGDSGEKHDELVDQDEEGLDEIQYTKDDEDAYDEYVDEEDARDMRAKKDKKKKKGDDGSRKIKKRRKNNGDDEAIEDPHAEEEEERKKSKKGNKKKAEEVKPEEVSSLIDKMIEAYEDDIDAFKMKKPALNKLKLLPEVDTLLKRSAFQQIFLESPNGLDALSKWLQKLPNGALPSLQIRKKLLDIIFQLPVQEDHLRESEIGKVVYGMRNNANEDPELKKTIKEIIDKWTRIITGANDYDQPMEDIRDRKKIDVSLDEYRQRSMSSLRRSIPRLTMKKSGYDFVRKPEAGTSVRNNQRTRTTEGECDKLIKDMKRKIKKDLR